MPADSSKELALFLEKMRFLRNISQEDFTDGIISNRQYQRYVRGESPMPYHLLDLFAERLNIKKDVLLLEFENHSLKETMDIYNYLSAISNHDYEQILLLRSKMDPGYIIDPDNRKLYSYAKLMDTFYEKKISNDSLKAKLSEMIGYPKILSQNVMSGSEVMILSTLLDFTGSDEQAKISVKIEQFLDNPDLVWSGNQIITYNIVIFRLAKFFGMNENYAKVITYCKLGIKFNNRTKSLNNLDYYYYCLSLSYFRLGKMLDYKENLYKCASALTIMNSPSRTQQITQLIESDFKINFKQFIIDYLKDKPGL